LALGSSARAPWPAAPEALVDVDAYRGWIIDQGAEVNRVADRVARAGFAAAQTGTPE
jgi:hypothetical protein